MIDLGVQALIFSILEALTRTLQNRVERENKLAIKRLVLEKILFCDTSRLQEFIDDDLETKAFLAEDITSTLDLFNRYLPAFFSGVGAFFIEGSTLLFSGAKIDPLALIYPSLLMIIDSLLKWAYHKYSTKKRRKQEKKMNEKFDNALLSSIEGIYDIQINNIQDTKMNTFDRIARKTIYDRNFLSSSFVDSLHVFRELATFSYTIEIWAIHKILEKQGIKYTKYAHTQQDIEHIFRIARRSMRVLRKAKHIFKHQSKVIQLLDMPSIPQEEEFPSWNENILSDFEELIIKDIIFSYSFDQLPVIQIDGDLTFRPGKSYAIIGPNISGKSTFVRLLCKLHEADSGSITLNGVEYSDIPPIPLRKFITYIPQNAYIFNGTLRQNIMVGNPNATQEEVWRAAQFSGVIDFLMHGESVLSRPLSSRKSKKKKKKDIPRRASSGDLIMRTVSYDELTPSKMNIKLISRSSKLIGNSSIKDKELDVYNDDLEDSDEYDQPVMRRNTSYARYPLLEQHVSNKSISAGFSQCIALARIFLRPDAKIIILDEALSDIDPLRLKRTILPNMFEFADKNNLCVIFVTRNIPKSIAKTFNEIYVLNNGRIVSKGSHNELMTNNEELYKSLMT
eukprot:TRINITY_DN3378_c0_g2_i2.p1 TRINITY_DN3378_c0_g2~~TRINITY_DN3378_c0_g2_i2.p1  ORF type:complete len:621 (-),score=123.37 TRINITY_DN3378_c0_g2_i2:60-1922(-)